MSEWRTTTTAELIEQGLIEIGDGYRAKNAEFVPNGGLPFLRVGDVGTNLRLEGPDELPLEQQVRLEGQPRLRLTDYDEGYGGSSRLCVADM